MMFAPGSRLGILGGGQLARMTALAARRLGYRVHVFDPAGRGCPAAPVCDEVAGASFDDAGALETFALGVDVASYEFENIPPAALRTVERFCPVRPGWAVLATCQHREREKLFLQRHGFPHAAFRVVTTAAELAAAVETLGTPCVLKTAESGYDGKGQVKILPAADPARVWQEWSGGETDRRGVVEAWVEFAAELSVICARNRRGELRPFPVFENIHVHHILDVTVCPARLPGPVQDEARELARAVTETLDVQGLLAVEMFLDGAGRVLVNELAPRPHNSGHLTLDACLTSQFEQHARAVCNLPLGAPDLLCPAVMVNLLGDLWPAGGGEPDWLAVLDEPTAKLHLYGKDEAKPGRKMGHFCVLDPEPEAAWRKAHAIRAQLQSGPALPG